MTDSDNKVKVLKNGDTALMVASDTGDIKGVVEALQSVPSDRDDFEAYLNLQNDGGMTALMLAANHNHYSIVDTLLKAGADVKLTNLQGYTAADLANRQEFDDVLDILVGSGAIRPERIVPPELDKQEEIVDTSDTVTTEENKDDGS